MFSNNEKRELRLLSLEKKNDATFLRRCLELLYAGNQDALRNKCVKRGTTKDRLSKVPITPTKLNAIYTEYRERILQQKDRMDAEELAARMNAKSINQMLSKAIFNINTRKARHDDAQEKDCKANTVKTETADDLQLEADDFGPYYLVEVST